MARGVEMDDFEADHDGTFRRVPSTDNVSVNRSTAGSQTYIPFRLSSSQINPKQVLPHLLSLWVSTASDYNAWIH